MSTLHQRLLAKMDDEAIGINYWVNANPFEDVVRALVEEHAPCHFLRVPLTTPICETCSADDDLHDVAWPCPPVKTIARELGVNLVIGHGEALGVTP